VLTNDWNFPRDALDIRNNIFWAASQKHYNGGSNGIEAGYGTISHNLYRGGIDTPDFDDSPISGDPRFVSPGTDFHLQTGSAAIDVGVAAVAVTVSDDYDGTARPQGSGFDIGAYEHAP
jgi:hypothetical protein